MRMRDWVLYFYNKYGIYPMTGGDNDGGDSPPPPPARPTAEQVLASSPNLQELDRMIRQYIGLSFNQPFEWGQYGDILQGLYGYTPQLTQLAEPTEYGQMATGLQELLGTNPQQFAYPMADIQKALDAQQAIQLQQYQNQIRPIMAQQGQLDSTYYANLLGDYLKNQQAQSLGNTANLLTNQATQNFNLAQWLPQFKSSVLGQMGNLGQVRQGVNQYNVGQQNQLQYWLPEWRQGIGQAIAGLGGTKLGLEQYNKMLPLQTYIPGLQSIYGAASGEANQQYQDLMNQYNYQLQNWQNEQNQGDARSGLFGSMGGAGLGAALGALFALPTGGLSIGAGALLGSGIGGTAGSMLGSYLSPSYSQVPAAQSPISLSQALSYAYPQQLDLSGLMNSRYNPAWRDFSSGSFKGFQSYN